MAQFRTSRAFDIIFLLTVACLLWWAGAHRVQVNDWIYFSRYHPAAETAQIATDAGLNDYGRHVFYRGDPTFASRDEVTAQCALENIGCLNSKGQIFILDQTGQQPQTTVTAAHEMLHLAYRRLPQAEKDKLAPLLDQGIVLNAANGINDELRDLTTDDDRRDEAHSLLGSEYAHLPPELEQYYAQYFDDRTKVVAAETASQQ